MDTALFSPSSLFPHEDDSSDTEEKPQTLQNYVERRHQFPGMASGYQYMEFLLSNSFLFRCKQRVFALQNNEMRPFCLESYYISSGEELLIREFSFHELNANLLWPGAFAFAEWLVQHQSWLQGRRCIELGSGTGALAIFLQKSFHLDITTSDYNDPEIEENISYNCRVNGISPSLPHINHSWGDTFPTDPDWDIVIASDILLYVKQYPNLIKTLCFLLKSYKPRDKELAAPQTIIDGSSGSLPQPAFLMSWRRRIGKEEESLFFKGCEEAGLEVKHIGSRVYCISVKDLP